MDLVYQYPPELFQLLVDTIPRLCRSKQDVLVFFRGAGVPDSLLLDLRTTLAQFPKEVNKFGITRTVLTRLNERGEPSLRERREVLKRVVEFEDFSTCWPEDQLKAKGLVAEIRRVIGVKDSFTRIRQERDKEAQVRRDELLASRERRKRNERRAQQRCGSLLQPLARITRTFAEQRSR